MTSTLVICQHCQEDASVIHIKCVECQNTTICLQCFSRGSEFNTHLNGHSYTVVNKGMFTLIDQTWSASEEKTLLDTIEQFGIGNWDDSGQNLERRTAKEIEEHYMNCYIESLDMGRLTVPNDIPNRMTDHTPPLHESILSVQLTPVDITKGQALEMAFMPLRDDYEMEHHNEAEVIISGLVINREEDEVDLHLKLARVEMYLDSLKERYRRKTIAREYHIIEKFFGKARTEIKQDHELLKRLRHCSQYMRKEQFLQFAKDARKEQNLHARIKQLKIYRKHGITQLNEGLEFDVKVMRKTCGSEFNHSELIINLNEKLFDRFSFEYGWHSLSSNEKLLCKSLKMLPSHYITIKILIIKDFLQKQQGVGLKVRFPNCLDKYQRKRIQSFLFSNCWLARA